MGTTTVLFAVNRPRSHGTSSATAQSKAEKPWPLHRRWVWHDTAHFDAATDTCCTVQELAEQQRRILTKNNHLFIQQLAPRAYISPLFTRERAKVALRIMDLVPQPG
jgi:hypothetical protein